MKKSGIMILENLFSLVLILIISGSIFLGIGQLKGLYNKYEHNKFKMNFLNFINLGRYRAFNESSVYILRFSERGIALVDKYQVTVSKFNFPKNVKMIKFNGINNRTLKIQRDGLIARGATLTYLFGKNLNEIIISAVTGKVNYG